MIRIGLGLGITTIPYGRGATTPKPPSKAPILMVDAEALSFIANLDWTASNRTGSPGFTYDVYVNVDGGGFSFLDTTTALTYNYDAGTTAGAYQFKVMPKNDYGEGPQSNIVSIDLPFLSSSSYRRPGGTALYYRPDGVSIYIRP